MVTLIGSVIGLIGRLLPEFIKFFDAKNERKHELDMQDKAIEFQRLKGEQKMSEITAETQGEFNEQALEALMTAIRGQDTPSGVLWIDGLSKLMRPIITIQWVIILYPAVIMAGFFIAINQGVGALDALVKVFGPEERGLVAAIINFWFLDRVFKHVRIGK